MDNLCVLLDSQVGFLGVTRDAIFATLTSSIIFILGYIGNRRYEKYVKRKELTRLKEYFLYLANLLDEPIKGQIKSFKSLSERLRSKEEKNFNLTNQAKFDISNIQNISQTDLYDIFLNQKAGTLIDRIKGFQKFQESLIFFGYILKKYPVDFEKFIERDVKYLESWNEEMVAIRKFYQLCASKTMAKESTEGEDLLLKEIHELLTKYGSTANYRDEQITIDSYLVPLGQICRKYITDERAPVFLHHSMTCISAGKNLVNNRKTYGDHFEKKADLLEKARLDFKSALKVIRS